MNHMSRPLCACHVHGDDESQRNWYSKSSRCHSGANHHVVVGKLDAVGGSFISDRFSRCVVDIKFLVARLYIPGIDRVVDVCA